MSLGSIIGGVAGGVIGFFAGGLTGAYYGAVLGFGIGMALDPITPDIPAPGDPNPQQQVMNGEIGGPIDDLCGTAKPVGKLLFFGKERNEKVYSEAQGGGGKGGAPEPQQQVTGFKYFQSWGVGLIACPTNPVDVLYAIYKNDDKEPVWPSAEDDDEDWEGLPLPVSGGQETIVIEGIGSVIFSFGTDDQMPIDAVEEIIADSTLNTPYRFLCWAFFDDCFIGEYPRTPTYKFILKKIPQIAELSDKGTIQKYDCNPSYAIWYILNTLSGLPTSWLNTDAFETTAVTLYVEFRGISILFDRQNSALSYLEAINSHIDNIIRYGSDGKFHPKLIRDDYDIDDLLLIDESVMLDNPTFNRGSWIDTINEIKIQYNEIIDVLRPKLLSGNVYSAGHNVFNQLGLDSAPDDIIVFEKAMDSLFFFVDCGQYFSAIINEDGELYACGLNTYGEAGIGSSGSPIGVFTICPGLWTVKRGGQDHSVGIRTDGTVWVVGRNHVGQIGFNDQVNRPSWTQYGSSLWADAKATYFGSVLLATNGIIWGTGGNSQGDLGMGDFSDKHLFTSTGFTADKIGNGQRNTHAIKENGDLHSTGLNTDGQLGLGDYINKNVFTDTSLEDVITVDGGRSHTMAVKSNGTLWATGLNDDGQLGLGNFTSRNTYIQVGTDTDWIDVQCGFNWSVAKKSDGTLYGTGDNQNGQFGLDSTGILDEFTLMPNTWFNYGAGEAHVVSIIRGID